MQLHIRNGTVISSYLFNLTPPDPPSRADTTLISWPTLKDCCVDSDTVY